MGFGADSSQPAVKKKLKGQHPGAFTLVRDTVGQGMPVPTSSSVGACRPPDRLGSLSVDAIDIADTPLSSPVLPQCPCQLSCLRQLYQGLNLAGYTLTQF